MKLVNLIFQESIKERATDIHIEPMEKQVYVRIRIDGVLQTIMTPPKLVKWPGDGIKIFELKHC